MTLTSEYLSLYSLFHQGSAGFSSDTQIVTRKAMKSVIASIKPSKDEKDNDEA